MAEFPQVFSSLLSLHHEHSQPPPRTERHSWPRGRVEEILRHLVPAILGAVLILGVMIGQAHARAWPWPLNGKVVNKYAESVAAWSDDKGIFRVPPRSDTGFIDVDHVQEPKTNRWCKIGWRTVTVQEDGTVRNCKCWATNYGKGCGS